jgi:hypothetical protein
VVDALGQADSALGGHLRGRPRRHFEPIERLPPAATADIEHVLEALRGDQGHRLDTILDDGVGHQGGAVHQIVDIVGRQAGRSQRSQDAGDRVVALGRHLQAAHLAAGRLQRDEIGEGAADIDAHLPATSSHVAALPLPLPPDASHPVGPGRPLSPSYAPSTARASTAGGTGAASGLAARPSFLARSAGRPPGGDPARRGQRRRRAGHQFVRFVEQTLRRAPKGEIDRGTLLLVGERRAPAIVPASRAERCPIALVDPQVERVVGDHAEHHAVAEHARLAEHPAQRDAAERRQLIAQELGEAVAGDHGPADLSRAGA